MTRACLPEKGKSKPLHFLGELVAKLDESMVLMDAQPADGSRPRIVLANEAFENKFGYKQLEVVGKNLQILIGTKNGPEAARPDLRGDAAAGGHHAPAFHV